MNVITAALIVILTAMLLMTAVIFGLRKNRTLRATAKIGKGSFEMETER